MNFNPDNLIYFYLLMSLVAVGFGLIAYLNSNKQSHSQK